MPNERYPGDHRFLYRCQRAPAYGEDIRFTHQLLQEYLASHVLLVEASRAGGRTGQDFWPAATWWERTGWEVMAEIAAESCDDCNAQAQLIAWLANANPDVASLVWQHLGQPDLLDAVLKGISNQWFERMADIKQAPQPQARAAIGRALGRFGLDQRKGVGLRPDGLPDIDWIKIPSAPFIYQASEHPAPSSFYIARYLLTNCQFQAFIDAGGYQEAAWWQGLAERFESPSSPQWSEPNSPRESVSWYEAIAYCRWLSAQLGVTVSLPTEQQWERAARGTQGFEYPWGNGYQEGYANCGDSIGGTSAVGIYPQAASPEGVLDLAGNLWEWCLNKYDVPEDYSLSGDMARVLRGGSWGNHPAFARSATRYYFRPDFRFVKFGFRVLCSSPIE